MSVVTRLFSYSKLKNQYVPNDQQIDKQLFPFSHHEESANFCINKRDFYVLSPDRDLFMRVAEGFTGCCGLESGVQGSI